MTLSDREYVEGMLANNDRIIHYFLFEACASMFSFIIKKIFDGRANSDELINELYLYLRENDWYKLRQFDYRSKLTTWLSVVSIRFFQKKRDELIEKGSKVTLYNIEKETAYDQQTQTIQRIDLETLINRLPNERYRFVIYSLMIKDIEPQQLADEMGITVDNLYNIKRRAIQQLIRIAGKEDGYVG